MSMVGGSDVGIRLFMIGKDGMLAGYNQLTAAQQRYNAAVAQSAAASKVGAAGLAGEDLALARHGKSLDIYKAQLAGVNAETAALARVGGIAFKTLAVATIAWTVESIKWAKDYQTQLLLLHTQAGLTIGDMNKIGAAAKANAASLGITPQDYVRSAYHPASVGYGTRTIQQIVKYGAEAGQISGAPTEDTVDTLTKVMRGYGMQGDKAQRTAATLNAIVGQGNLRYSQLNAAVASGVASTAAQYGVGLTSLGSSLARLTDVGIPGAQAGTRLRMALALLGAPTLQSTKILEASGLSGTSAQNLQSSVYSMLNQYGVNTTQLAYDLRNNKGGGGIYNALNSIHKALSSSGMDPEAQSATLSRAFGGGRMGAAITALYDNLPLLYQKQQRIEGAASPKKFNEDWIATTKTLRFQMHAFGGEVETLGVTFGTKLIPPLTSALGLMTSFMKLLDHHKGLAYALGGAIALVLVPAIGVYLKRALLSNEGSLMTVFRAYRRVITGTDAETEAVRRYNRILDANDAALAGNTGALDREAAAETRAARAGGLGGLGAGGMRGPAGTVAADAERGGLRGFLGRGVTAGGLAGGPEGLVAAAAGYGAYKGTMTILQHNPTLGKPLIHAATDVVSWLGMGPQIVKPSAHAGSAMVPYLTSILEGKTKLHGNVTMADIRSQYQDATGHAWVNHNITSAYTDQFKKPGVGQAELGPNRPHLVAHVYLDGKEITASVTKKVKANAARK
jgi:TP901 family phage tail tape measure protein